MRTKLRVDRSSVSRTGMSSARWEYLKALAPSLPRFVHVSCSACMRPNPLDPLLPWIPFVEKGTTYNVGSNERKRCKRDIDKAARAIARVQCRTLVQRPLTRRALHG